MRLFDPFELMLTQRTQQALLENWQGVFRHVILELMPVEVLGGAFDPAIGRPTKELYSMAGLLVVGFFCNLGVRAVDERHHMLGDGDKDGAARQSPSATLQPAGAR